MSKAEPTLTPGGRSTVRRPDAAYHHGDLKRAMVHAALGLLAEQQSWEFSLRQVARRAGVSHNAPYNHFASKRDLLATVAVTGFETLRCRMQEADPKTGSPPQSLCAIGTAYVQFGTENPAHYRLMFGPTLRVIGGALPPDVATAAGTAKAVLAEIVARGAKAGLFAAAPDDQDMIDRAVLSAWSIVHGLTMLLIDGMAPTDKGMSFQAWVAKITADTLLDGLLRRERGNAIDQQHRP